MEVLKLSHVDGKCQKTTIRVNMSAEVANEYLFKEITMRLGQ